MKLNFKNSDSNKSVKQTVDVDSFAQISLNHTHTALLIVELHFWS